MTHDFITAAREHKHARQAMLARLMASLPAEPEADTPEPEPPATFARRSTGDPTADRTEPQRDAHRVGALARGTDTGARFEA